MAQTPRISLEQWQALTAVVEAGGYARAAERLHKSQSSVTYAVQKIEQLLGIKVFELKGRKAELTPPGQLLYQRGRALVDEAGVLEQSARALSAGWEAEIRFAVEIVFPNWLLLHCLASFAAESPHTRIELIESVIGGAVEAIGQGQVDLAITPQVPDGFLGESLMRARFVAAAHPEHALHRLGRKLSFRDLRAHRHLVVRDTGSTRSKASVSVDAAQRWTVSHIATSVEAARMGLGFAWFPEERIRPELEQGVLKPLPLAEGVERYVELYLVISDPEFAGPGTLRLAEIVRAAVADSCPQAARAAPAAAAQSGPPTQGKRARKR